MIHVFLIPPQLLKIEIVLISDKLGQSFKQTSYGVLIGFGFNHNFFSWEFENSLKMVDMLFYCIHQYKLRWSPRWRRKYKLSSLLRSRLKTDYYVFTKTLVNTVNNEYFSGSWEKEYIYIFIIFAISWIIGAKLILLRYLSFINQFQGKQFNEIREYLNLRQKS